MYIYIYIYSEREGENTQQFDILQIPRFYSVYQQRERAGAHQISVGVVRVP